MADKNITELTAVTDVADTDIVYVVRDPGGGNLDHKITGADLKAALNDGKVAHDGTPLVGELVRVKSLSPLVVEGLDSGAYATSAQGALADSAVQPGDDAADLGSDTATDGHVLTADGAGGAAWEAAPAGGGGGGATVVIKSADETVHNSVTVQDDDELSYAIAANEAVDIRMALFVVSSTTPDFRFAFSAPSGADVIYGIISVNRGNDGIVQQVKFEEAADTEIVAQTPIASVPAPMQVMATVRNGATAGTVKFRWAQGTEHASDTTVKAGTSLVVNKVA